MAIIFVSNKNFIVMKRMMTAKSQLALEEKDLEQRLEEGGFTQPSFIV